MDECVRVLDHMPERNPTDGTFELTIRCNLHCKMCLFRHDDSENAEIMAKELSAEQWIDMARQVAEAGTLSLLITGGEPMLRPDFCEIWEGIYKQGFVITLYTNATLVTPKIMETLRKYPPHKIGVTIYGASPETYEKVTGSAAAFERAIEGIRQLKTLPSQLEYRMTVIKDNYDDVDAVEELLQKEIDPGAVLIISRYVSKATRGACAKVEACRPLPGALFDLSIRRTINEIKREVGEQFDDRFISIDIDKACQEGKNKSHFTVFGCEAGMKSFTVSWDGYLLPCQLMNGVEKRISGSFLEAWHGLIDSVEIPIRPAACFSCKYASLCHICTATWFIEAGNYSDLPEFLCNDAKACFDSIQKLSKNNLIGGNLNEENV